MDYHFHENDNHSINLTPLFDILFSNKVRLYTFLKEAQVKKNTIHFMLQYIYGKKNLDELTISQIRLYMNDFLEDFTLNKRQIVAIPSLRFFLQLTYQNEESIEDELKGYFFYKFENKFQTTFLMEKLLIEKIISDILEG